MKKLTFNILSFSLLTATLLLNGCSSHNDIVSISETHLYNNHYGVKQNLYVDSIIQNELIAENEPTQIDRVVINDPSYTTDISMDSDAFLAEDYVEQPEIITYKYKFDKKFYSEATWRKMDLD